MQQSVSLLHIKDPLFKRMGASRLARFAIDGSFNVNMMQVVLRKRVYTFGFI